MHEIQAAVSVLPYRRCRCWQSNSVCSELVSLQQYYNGDTAMQPHMQLSLGGTLNLDKLKGSQGSSAFREEHPQAVITQLR